MIQTVLWNTVELVSVGAVRFVETDILQTWRAESKIGEHGVLVKERGDPSIKWHGRRPSRWERLKKKKKVGLARHPFESRLSSSHYIKLKNKFATTLSCSYWLFLCLIILSCLPSRYTGRVVQDVINLGSYNYLGFAENTGPCADSAAEITMKYGVGVASTRQEIGTKTRHAPLPLLSL